MAYAAIHLTDLHVERQRCYYANRKDGHASKNCNLSACDSVLLDHKRHLVVQLNVPARHESDDRVPFTA
jgi:hypothetical protein